MPAGKPDYQNWKRLGRGLLILVGAFVLWAAVTENPVVWPIRNTVEYHLTRAWWNLTGEPSGSPVGGVTGTVVTPAGSAIANAIVILSE